MFAALNKINQEKKKLEISQCCRNSLLRIVQILLCLDQFDETDAVMVYYEIVSVCVCFENKYIN